MKTVTMQEARARWREVIAHAQSEPVVITRHGKPVAVLLPPGGCGPACPAVHRRRGRADGGGGGRR